MLFKTALLTAMAALATAYTQPDYTKSPSGNAIVKPGLNDVVTAGKPYTIQWEPTTQGPISLVLLRGPSTNVKPIDTLAEGIANSGHFDWTPNTELEPDTTHYGLLLVVEGTGQYQYSTQFGVKNDQPQASSSTPASSPYPIVTDAPVPSNGGQFNQQTIYSTEQFVTTKCPKCSSEAAAASSSAIATAPAPASTLASVPVKASSSSVAAVSSAPLIPSSVAPVTASSSASASASASSSAPSSLFTGAADRNTVGMGAVAAGVLAAMVL